MSIPDESADVYQSWCQSVQPFDSFSRLLDLWPPKTPWNATLVLWGEFYLAYVHSQTNLPTCTKFGANRCSRLPVSPDFWMCDPYTPAQNVTVVLRGDLYLAHVHSLMNPQMWTKVGANRSSRLTASSDFWICDPLKPPEMPPGLLWGELYLAYDHSQTKPPTCTNFDANRCSRLTASRRFEIVTPNPPPQSPLWYWGATCIYPMSIPRWIRRREPKLMPIGAAVWQPARLLNVWPLTHQVPPFVWRGNLFGVYLFPDESAHVYQSVCQSIQPFDSCPIILNLWPLTPRNALGVLRGELYLAYVHSQRNPQTCTKFGANRSSRLQLPQTFKFVTP